MFSLPYLNKNFLHRIGIWKDDEKIVALATYETELDEVFICIDNEYNYLKKDVFLYAQIGLSTNGKPQILIDDNDYELQHIALNHGFRPTQEKQLTSMIDINESITYELPKGYSVASLAENFDIYGYNKVLWRGFNHKGEPSITDEQILDRRISLSGPNVNLDLNIVVIAPNGNFVSYCGIWYDTNTDYALVEPVATDPDYRKMGLGKTAVLEAVKRCGKLGAKRAYVGSSQQFYYNIGFYPISTETFWYKK